MKKDIDILKIRFHDKNRLENALESRALLVKCGIMKKESRELNDRFTYAYELF